MHFPYHHPQKTRQSQTHAHPISLRPMAYNHSGSNFCYQFGSWLQATETHAESFKLTGSLGLPQNQALRLATRKCPKSDYRTSEDSTLLLPGTRPSLSWQHHPPGHWALLHSTASFQFAGRGGLLSTGSSCREGQDGEYLAFSSHPVEDSFNLRGLDRMGYDTQRGKSTGGDLDLGNLENERSQTCS